MRKNNRILLLFVFCCYEIFSQNIVKGCVKDETFEKEVTSVFVYIKNTEIKANTLESGCFMLTHIPNGKQTLTIEKEGYKTQNYPILFKGKEIDLGDILLYKKELLKEDLSVITLTDDELNEDTIISDNIAGLLHASKDTYLRTVAFQWSPAFYKIRGLGSEYGKVLLNGIEMNTIFNGRPQWNNWGGLNDATRNQEFNNGLNPSYVSFGGLLGTTNININATEQRKGSKITYSSSNRSYRHRILGSYASGLLKNGWAFAISASKRLSNEGFVNGTSYNANSLLFSAEKILNEKHSINFSSIYAFNQRGKSAPNTQEVYDIKGIKYNPYWGYQNGKIRNSRIREIEEPIFMLNHYWKTSKNSTLQNNVSYQFGKIGNSRIDYNGTRLLEDGITIVGGGSNPDPTYYQKLPSYVLATGFGDPYALLNSFENDGQLNWTDLYQQNLANTESNNAKYIVYEDRTDNTKLNINSILTTQLSEKINLNAKLNYSKIKSKNFANVLDLLGGTYFLDVNFYGNTFYEKQNDLQHVNRTVTVGDAFKYNYHINSEVFNAFAQGEFKHKKVDLFLAGSLSKTTHQREGLYQNGVYSNNSLGTSNKLNFLDFSGKTGATYKITGRHLLNINLGYFSKPPSVRNSFSNARQHNFTVANLKSEKNTTIDASYILRSPKIQTKLTGYYTTIKDATNITFFYADGLLGDGSSFIQEITTGINKKHMGAELGIEIKATSNLKIKGAANFGAYTYNNNPNLYFTSDDPEYNISQTKSFLKGYKIASGPQKAYALGIEYNDPNYWWFGINGNFFDDIYIAASKLKRTANFALDSDGLPFNNYNETIAKELLQQEEIDNYFTLNAVGGKSWYIKKNKYIGFFASINNILNTTYKTGGFEQSRSLNYQTSLEESKRTTPLFGNKYWYGRGTTYFLNLSYKF